MHPKIMTCRDKLCSYAHSLVPSPHFAHTSPYTGKITTGGEGTMLIHKHKMYFAPSRRCPPTDMRRDMSPGVYDTMFRQGFI